MHEEVILVGGIIGYPTYHCFIICLRWMADWRECRWLEQKMQPGGPADRQGVARRGPRGTTGSMRNGPDEVLRRQYPLPSRPALPPGPPVIRAWSTARWLGSQGERWTRFKISMRIGRKLKEDHTLGLHLAYEGNRWYPCPNFSLLHFFLIEFWLKETSSIIDGPS